MRPFDRISDIQADPIGLDGLSAWSPWTRHEDTRCLADLTASDLDEITNRLLDETDFPRDPLADLAAVPTCFDIETERALDRIEAASSSDDLDIMGLSMDLDEALADLDPSDDITLPLPGRLADDIERRSLLLDRTTLALSMASDRDLAALETWILLTEAK